MDYVREYLQRATSEYATAVARAMVVGGLLEGAQAPAGRRLHCAILGAKFYGQIIAVIFPVPTLHYAFDMVRYERKLRATRALERGRRN